MLSSILQNVELCVYFMLPPPCQRHLLSSGMLRSVDWQLIADVSGQSIGTISKGQAVQEECILLGMFEDGIDSLSRNVGMYLPNYVA